MVTWILGNYDFKLQLAQEAGKMKGQNIRQLGIITKFIEAAALDSLNSLGSGSAPFSCLGKMMAQGTTEM